MTDANAKKLYVHFKELIAGKMKTGNAIRDELIVSDATVNLADLIKKRPNIDFEPKEIEEIKEAVKEAVKEVKKIKKISKEE